MSACDIGALAMQCLLQEIDTYPKPGLVSSVDCGSHRDMDAPLLRRSARVLQPYFADLAAAGAHQASLPHLQAIGRAAEAAMLRETGGINTHRGAIFGLGLLCAAAALSERDAGAGARALGVWVQDFWAEDIAHSPADADSHGARVQRRHGAGGARAEAVGGFQTLYRVAWPALRRGRELAPGDENAARVQCCFALIAVTADTNVLFRGGAEGLLFAQCAAREFIDSGGVGAAGWLLRAEEIHRAFVHRGLSPGGCADLLAMSLFLDAWQARAEHAQALCVQAPPVPVPVPVPGSAAAPA